jgi:hypothetical protein
VEIIDCMALALVLSTIQILGLNSNWREVPIPSIH